MPKQSTEKSRSNIDQYRRRLGTVLDKCIISTDCIKLFVGRREKHQLLQSRDKPRDLRTKEVLKFKPSKHLQVWSLIQLKIKYYNTFLIGYHLFSGFFGWSSWTNVLTVYIFCS